MDGRDGTKHVCQVLVEDSDLADAIPADRRARALERILAPELRVGPGKLTPIESFPADAIGLLVLSGLVLRRLALDGRFGVELLGECDILRPWQDDDRATLPVESHWSVLAPTRFAILDESFGKQLGSHPELVTRLVERTVRRSRRLLVNMAIVHQARVDVRLRMLFWHLAARWGRVRGDGVVLPLRLTHAVLADLVAARRPTVTSALSSLSREGLVKVVSEGWLLSGGSPPELRQPD